LVEEGDVVMLGVVLQQLHHLLHVVLLETWVGEQLLFELGFRDIHHDASFISILTSIALAFPCSILILTGIM
jgi:hypothetical protein